MPEGICTARLAPLELLVEARLRAGDVAGARQAHEQLAALAQRCATAHVKASARFAAGLIAVAAGDLTEARIAFEDAVGGFRRARSPYECIRARLELAEVLHDIGRSEAARRSAATALSEAGRLGAEPLCARAGQLLASSEEAIAGPLTAREREVLSLVAEGLTGGEIAGRLVLSLHTVHRHMANIRTKLSAPSRAAAVAAARDLGLI